METVDVKTNIQFDLINQVDRTKQILELFVKINDVLLREFPDEKPQITTIEI